MFCSVCGKGVVGYRKICEECEKQNGAVGLNKPRAVARPALWNPKAVAVLSFFLTPLYGCFLHYNNWKALKDEDSTAKSMLWLVGSAILLLYFLVMLAMHTHGLRESGPNNILALLFYALWYKFQAQSQIEHVTSLWGDNYERKSVIVAAISFLAFLFLSSVVVHVTIGAIAG
jgi:uncharacterized membrane protein YhaH (DUF805 family)